MANPNAKAPTSANVVLYIEQQVDDWTRARIAGKRWIERTPESPTFIRRKEVLRRIGVSHMTIYSMEKAGKFPRGIKLREITADGAEYSTLPTQSTSRVRRSEPA